MANNKISTEKKLRRSKKIGRPNDRQYDFDNRGDFPTDAKKKRKNDLRPGIFDQIPEKKRKNCCQREKKYKNLQSQAGLADILLNKKSKKSFPNQTRRNYGAKIGTK